MTDIILIQPPIEDFYFTYKRTIPYGLASIASSLLKQNFSVEILDCLAVKKSKVIQMPSQMDYLLKYYDKEDSSIFSLFHEFRHYGYSYEYAAKIVRDKKPFLVGISSLFTPYSNYAEKTAQAVKEFYPNCKIVMGGHHPTVLPQEVMKCSAVDFVLRGEGEMSMPMLAKAIKNGDNLKEIQGIVFREKDKELYISEPSWIEDFSILPPPQIQLVNHNFYSRRKVDDNKVSGNSKKLDNSNTSKSIIKRGSTVVVANRGCPMPCTYCSVGASSSHGRFRQRTIKSVINELEAQITKYNIGFIDFEDENLTLNRKWFLELMDEIVRICGTKDIELRAMNGLYPPSLDEEVIIAMKSAGFKTLNLSLGSTSQEQLKRFKRPDVRVSFENVLSIAESYGLETVSYLIAGSPYQNPDDSLNDLLFLAQKKTLIGLSIFYPAPGSVDYEKCVLNGLLPQDFSLMRSSTLPIDHTTSRIQSVTLLRIARVINFMKSIVNEDRAIPKPEPYKDSNIGNTASSLSQRRESGVTLLKWFLHDGVLRGINKAGKIFEHFVDFELCTRFVKEVQNLLIR
ncbi:MAG: B12-binding domain-containing radical SAM protein [Desulfamplus sp.]|nr:B12-binding domain-containing radical SAM protein [Desulfamplus sp.]